MQKDDFYHHKIMHPNPRAYSGNMSKTKLNAFMGRKKSQAGVPISIKDDRGTIIYMIYGLNSTCLFLMEV